jgi:hypothetical protein
VVALAAFEAAARPRAPANCRSLASLGMTIPK